MPRYDYACASCKHEFEIEQRISDDRIKTCPACSQDTVERLISHSTFQLKGSGWAADNYSSPTKGKDK